jgi:putative addiction module component (TIGR02574 family)
MTTTISQDQLQSLQPAERLALIGALWDSLDDLDRPLTPAQSDELRRRLDSFEQDQTGAVAWSDLKAELQRAAR